MAGRERRVSYANPHLFVIPQRSFSRSSLDGTNTKSHATYGRSRYRFSPPRGRWSLFKNPTWACRLGLLCDLLWSDPDKDVNGWGENDRGVSFTFGSDIVSKFLGRHDLDLICRAHQVKSLFFCSYFFLHLIGFFRL